ncbi:MAG TPA: PA0069 family radical SAM protein [Patescibacteria group bacterium]|nr:PA0069 family radical SAM protein [Patescibacteria group bacterium]
MSKRGTTLDTGNRFITTTREKFDDGWESFTEEPDPQTQFLKDTSRTAFATNTSPDIPFTHSINSYRGCEHGCTYCYARPTHEYLGFNAGLDFETKIMVKHDIAELARAEMLKKSWQPTIVSMSGVTDPYQPCERTFGLSREILKVMHQFKNPISIITKNALVLRDIDILAEMAKENLASVFISITTLDRDLARRMEPRTSTPELRLKAIEKLSAAGVPVGVMMAPLIPGLTDNEIPELLKRVAEAGARNAYYVIVRLPLAVKPIFLNWLTREEPGRAEKIAHRLEEMRDGKLNRTEFGKRMVGEGAHAEMIRQIFKMSCRKYGLNKTNIHLSTDAFQRPGEQIGMF